MLWFIEHFFCGSRYWFSGIKSCGCCGRLVTATATRAEGLVKFYGLILMGTTYYELTQDFNVELRC